MKMEPTEGSETSAIINQTPGNYPKENLLYSVHGESLKSRKLNINCMKKGISVDEKISEFKLFGHNESFYFMDEIVMNPTKE